MKKIRDLKPIDAYRAYVDDAINEKLLTYKEINNDPEATIVNN